MIKVHAIAARGQAYKEGDSMNAIRKEIHDYIDCLSDSKLEALKPVLAVLADESVVIEADLTEEERGSIAKGEEEYGKGGYVPLEDAGWD